MTRIFAEAPRLAPMTLKVDNELKVALAELARRERRTPSSAAYVLLQYGVVRWQETGTLQRLIDEIDKAGQPGTQKLRKTLRP